MGRLRDFKSFLDPLLLLVGGFYFFFFVHDNS